MNVNQNMTFDPIKDGTHWDRTTKNTKHVDNCSKIHPDTKFERNPSTNAAVRVYTRMSTKHMTFDPIRDGHWVQHHPKRGILPRYTPYKI